jgi:mRNA-degrading endonuclease RelE of RelBE toxin-antitoxin system
MNLYDVEWSRDVERDLANFWLNAADPDAITAAQADQLLARNPLGHGKPLPEGLYRLQVPPLVLVYTVDTARRQVRVTGVGLLP